MLSKLRQFLARWRKRSHRESRSDFSVGRCETFIKSLSFYHRSLCTYRRLMTLLHYRIALHDSVRAYNFSSRNGGTSNFNRCALRNSDRSLLFSSINVRYETSSPPRCTGRLINFFISQTYGKSVVKNSARCYHRRISRRSRDLPPPHRSLQIYN